MWLGDCMIRGCYAMKGIPARIFCILLVITQGALLDYYLIKHQTLNSIAWMAFDLFNVAMFIISFVVSQRHLSLQKAGNEEKRALTLGWFAWTCYAVSLVARISIAFNKFSWRLDENDFFGPNTLKTALALSAVVFIFLLMSHHDAPVESERRRYIEELTGTVVFDVLDTVDILDVMFERESRDRFLPGMEQTILAVAGINILIPTVPLITLSLTNFGRKKVPKMLVAAHKLSVAMVINLPNLIVRLILWHGFSVGISPFMLKNLILICITLYEFYEHKKMKYDEHAREGMEMNSKINHNYETGSATVSEADNVTFPMEERI